jgi:hypothetical protein
MKDIARELEFLRVEKEKELKKRQAEYTRLTVQATLVGVTAFITQLSSVSIDSQAPWRIIIEFGGLGFLGAVFIFGFFIRAHQSPIGIRGYIDIEKRLFISEIPNIFQIISVLSILNVLLKEHYVRLLGTIIVTFLLITYLTAKRRDIIFDEPEQVRSSITNDVTTLLSVSDGIFFGLIVYGLASLISFQAA